MYECVFVCVCACVCKCKLFVISMHRVEKFSALCSIIVL